MRLDFEGFLPPSFHAKSAAGGRVAVLRSPRLERYKESDHEGARQAEPDPDADGKAADTARLITVAKRSTAKGKTRKRKATKPAARDDFGEKLLKRKGSIDPDAPLEF